MNSTTHKPITDSVTLRRKLTALEAETRACEPETRKDYWNARYAMIVEPIECDMLMDICIEADCKIESANFYC